jgi:hypothetical protein
MEKLYILYFYQQLDLKNARWQGQRFGRDSKQLMIDPYADPVQT